MLHKLCLSGGTDKFTNIIKPVFYIHFFLSMYFMDMFSFRFTLCLKNENLKKETWRIYIFYETHQAIFGFLLRLCQEDSPMIQIIIYSDYFRSNDT